MLKSGFVSNEDKSLWEPVQIFSWLGVILNTIDGSVKATDDRIVKLTKLTDLGTLSSQPPSRNVHVKTVASVAGQIISLFSCLGSVCRIMTRHPFSVVNSALSWDSEVLLSEDFISEIKFWVNNAHSLNGKVYWGVQSLPVKVFMVFHTYFCLLLSRRFSLRFLGRRPERYSRRLNLGATAVADRVKTAVLSSKVESTSLLYYRAYRKWKDFAVSNLNGSVFPASPFQSALYLCRGVF